MAFIAGAAAAMSVHDEMKGWQKCIWLLVIGAFLITELRAIHKDYIDNDAKALADRNAQDIAFKSVRDAQDLEFKATAEGLKSDYELNQKHFDATMNRSDALYKAESRTTNLALQTLEQTEGGDGYCWLTPLSPQPSQTATNPPWSVIVGCQDKKKLPIVDVFVMIQEALSAHPTPEEIDAKAWHGPHYQLGTLPSGGWEPTQIELKPGKYNISIFSRKNAVLEQISFGDFDPKTQTAHETFCVYQYQTGHLLTGSKECPNPR